MTSTAKTAARPRWTHLFAPIGTELEAVEARLQSELRSDDPFVDRMAQHAFRLGGKRLRPALLLLAAKAAGKVTADHTVLAVVMEMIHTATLVHDDVLDDAALRRHQPTVNACEGNEASVLTGDFLFSHSFYLASTLGTTYACRLIGQSTSVVCAGEIRQVHSRGNFGLTEAEYLQIIDAKTAELCACCCRLGAHYAGASESVEDSLARYGRQLGIAFQIADDLLDFWGTEAATGKSLGTDLEKQKPTLPLIRLLSMVSETERAELLEQLEVGNVRRSDLAGWFERSGALTYCERAARRHAQAARQELAALPASPAKEVLERLTEAAVSREG